MAAPKRSNVQNIQMRLKSSSDRSQRRLTQRELSRITAIKNAGSRKPVCQPQKNNDAPRRNGGAFMKPRNSNHNTRTTASIATTNNSIRPLKLLRLEWLQASSFGLPIAQG